MGRRHSRSRRRSSASRATLSPRGSDAYSLEEFGLKEGSTTAEPRLLFKLVARANHSNFPECTECRHNRMEKEQNIASRAPRDRRDATNAKQVAHVRDCSDERAVTS